MIGRQGLSPSRDPDLHQLPVGVAEGAIAKRTPPESLPFIGICGIDPGFVRSCHGGQVNEASHDVNHRSHCSTRIRFLYTCDQVDTYRSYDGTDENGIVGTVAPGLFAQEGRCWRMVYENPVGHGTHCMQPVEWVGRWKFLKGWTKVWSCERHADELVVGARRCREL